MPIKQKQPVDSTEVVQLFRRAVIELERGHLHWRKKQYQPFTQALQISASCLLRALFAADGIPPKESEADRRLQELLTSADTEYTASMVYRGIRDVLKIDPATGVDRTALKETFSNYRSAMIKARKIIADKLNVDEKHRLRLKQAILSRAGRRRLSVILLVLLLLAALPAALFKYTRPIARLPLDGQVFWKNMPGVAFDAQHTQRYAVVADDQLNDYVIDFATPQNIFMLRLDPVNKQYLTEVEIESIQLLGQSDHLLRKLEFDGSMYWSCDNCLDLQKKAGSYQMRPANSDLFLTSSPIEQDGVEKLVIRMRVVARKTFWEWLLRIDRGLEF